MASWREFVAWPKHAFHKHVEHERASAASKVEKDKLFLLATLALVSVALSALTRVMTLAKYATLTPDGLATYHPTTPWFTIVATLLFMYVAWEKGVRYWLVYATSVLTLVPNVALVLLFAGVLEPSDLRMFDWGPSWWKGA